MFLHIFCIYYHNQWVFLKQVNEGDYNWYWMTSSWPELYATLFYIKFAVIAGSHAGVVLNLHPIEIFLMHVYNYTSFTNQLYWTFHCDFMFGSENWTNLFLKVIYKMTINSQVYRLHSYAFIMKRKDLIVCNRWNQKPHNRF